MFKQSNIELKKLIKTAKAQHYNGEIKESTTTRALFNITKTMMGKSTSSAKFPTHYTQSDLPDAFGHFFKEKVSVIRNNLNKQHHSPPTFEQFDGDTVLCEFKPVTEDELKNIIRSSPLKSCCLDPIETSLLVNFLDYLAPVLTTIVNESLRFGIVPKSFKHAIVTPILKKLNLSPEEMKHFRPVSNLPFISKILEKVVARQLRNHLAHFDLFEPNQSAYRQHYNTETALSKIQNDLLCAADEGKVSILALLDLSAAFDTLDHTILIERLSKTFGLRGTVLNWFKSYLSDRTQSISVNGILSSPFCLDYGVPQGSVLGPVLYTLYTQPLGKIITRNGLHHHMYADDTQLYKSVIPVDTAHLLNCMESCILNVKLWMTTNKLKLNEDKTEILLCNPKNLSCPGVPNTIKVENDEIKFSRNAKNLGVYFDNKLSMEVHINYLCKTLYLELRRIGHMSHFLNLNSLKTLTSAFIFSRIDYCNSLFFNLPNFLINKLQRIQNHAARIILKRKKSEHISPMLLSLHWLPVEKRIIYKIATLCYKCKNKTAPTYLNNFITDYIPTRQLRSTNKCLLNVPEKKGLTKLSQRSFMHAGPNVWNSLPLSLRLKYVDSEDTFKKHLKTYLMRCFLNEL